MMDSSPIVPPPSQSFSRSELDASSVPKAVKKFYRGQPLALGITQILIGMMQIAFGIPISIAAVYRIDYFAVMVPYWTGILYIISGSLSVAAARNPKMPIVKGMLGMNVVSTVAAGIGIIFLSFAVDHFYYNVQWEVVVVYQNVTPGNAVSLPAAVKDPEYP
ncbi:membrane-spanning 4-domains subfamily A member 15-like isoform X2 [Rhineura floridana]|uniref:membrane-spanning 4-domains subfamily A member 15-like isoform X2 n=1 Tax=Rhineura floridana TaxID=261503 RepID=UPI002AC7F89A|nr:membrane-spanning 4-domains subfamily A member 15-like isoform X2 [Rhineura floridana]